MKSVQTTQALIAWLLCGDVEKKNCKGLKMKRVTWDSAKTFFCGVVLIIGGCWFWYHEAGGNPLHELALIRRAQITTGSLVDTYEHEQEDYRGHVYYSDVGIYSYRLPDGREFKTSTRVPTGQLKEQQEVEYLPNNPEVSRIKGDGCNSVTEFLWRKVGVGSLFLAICITPGIFLVRQAFSENTKNRDI
ncbi:MAG: DUF3592 domain-containing protein [Desulfobacterales bacterium]|nr:DUF3592 domain-containing protein [Desulfobacterales bacterium]